jgi:hypothetical protein
MLKRSLTNTSNPLVYMSKRVHSCMIGMKAHVRASIYQCSKQRGDGSRFLIAFVKNRAHSSNGKQCLLPIRRPLRQLTPLTWWASVSGKRRRTQVACGLAKECCVQPTPHSRPLGL